MGLPVRQLRGFLIVFIIVSVVAFFMRKQLADLRIDYTVVLAANTLLFLLGLISLGLHVKALKNTNPQAFIRSVMLANILKLFTLAAAAYKRPCRKPHHSAR